MEIKGQKGDSYVVEFSKGPTPVLKLSRDDLEKYFPAQHQHLLTQRSSSQTRPMTPASSCMSPSHSSAGLSLQPRSSVQLPMSDCETASDLPDTPSHSAALDDLSQGLPDETIQNCMASSSDAGHLDAM